MTNPEIWTFPQRIRVAADILREVAVYRCEARDYSSKTPYTAAQLDEIAETIKQNDRQQIDALAGTIYEKTTGGHWDGCYESIRKRFIECARFAIEEEGWHQ